MIFICQQYIYTVQFATNQKIEHVFPALYVMLLKKTPGI